MIDPLHKVKDIEADISQLSHLRCMYLFVVDSVRRQAIAPASENNSEEVYRCKSLEWDKIVVNYFHNLSKYKCISCHYSTLPTCVDVICTYGVLVTDDNTGSGTNAILAKCT